MPHQCTGCGHTFADGSKEMLSGCPECGGNKFQFRPAGASSSDDSEAGSSVATPGSADEDVSTSDAQPPDADARAEPPANDTSSVAETVGRATTKVRDFVSSTPSEPDAPDPNAAWPSESDASGTDADSDADAGSDPAATPSNPYPSSGTDTTDDDIIDADARRQQRDGGEDVAQVNARSDVVSPDELGDAASSAGANATDDSPGDGAEPSVGSDGEVVSEPSGDEPDLSELREQLNDQFESIKIVEPGQYELNLMELYDREEYIIALQENGRYVIQVPDQWLGEEPGER